RIRTQWALEGAATAVVLASAVALAVVFAMRMEWLEDTTGIVLLIGSALIVVAGAAISAARRLDDEQVARRIDRASHLSDRLSTAIAFDRLLLLGSSSRLTEAAGRTLATGAPADHETTVELMHAAIGDGV